MEKITQAIMQDAETSKLQGTWRGYKAVKFVKIVSKFTQPAIFSGFQLDKSEVGGGMLKVQQPNRAKLPKGSDAKL